MLNTHIFTFNLFQEHTMVAWAAGPQCIIVDPGCHHPTDFEELYAFLDDSQLTPVAILLTHGHLDHTFGVKALQEKWDIPTYMHPADGELPDRPFNFPFTPVEDGQVLKIADMQFKVITTPGHTPGSVCFLDEGNSLMFTGDTLFAGTIGRSDFSYSDYDDEIRSIMEKLIWLDPAIEIYPGHGPSSTIGNERTTNPFLEPFNELGEDVPLEL